jgi:hypothetical protein
MTVELALAAMTNAGFAVIAAFEYFAQAPLNVSAMLRDRLNRRVWIVLGSCVLIGNLIIWIPALCGF